MEKIRIGISACLLGQNVRYDGGHRLALYIMDTLGHRFDWVPVCPEVEYGLPVPRETLHLIGDPQSPHLLTTRTRIDHTEGMLTWAEKRLAALATEDLGGFVLKSRSPSCGLASVDVYDDAGVLAKKGTGVFAGALIRRFPLLPVEDADRLRDPVIREAFIEQTFACRRLREMGRAVTTPGGL